MISYNAYFREFCRTDPAVVWLCPGTEHDSASCAASESTCHALPDGQERRQPHTGTSSTTQTGTDVHHPETKTVVTRVVNSCHAKKNLSKVLRLSSNFYTHSIRIIQLKFYYIKKGMHFGVTELFQNRDTSEISQLYCVFYIIEYSISNGIILVMFLFVLAYLLGSRAGSQAWTLEMPVSRTRLKTFKLTPTISLSLAHSPPTLCQGGPTTDGVGNCWLALVEEEEEESICWSLFHSAGSSGPAREARIILAVL